MPPEAITLIVCVCVCRLVKVWGCPLHLTKKVPFSTSQDKDVATPEFPAGFGLLDQ